MRDIEAAAQEAVNQIGADLDANMRQWSSENAGKPLAEVSASLVAFWAVATDGDPLDADQVQAITESVSRGGVFYIENSNLMVSDPDLDE